MDVEARRRGAGQRRDVDDDGKEEEPGDGEDEGGEVPRSAVEPHLDVLVGAGYLQSEEDWEVDVGGDEDYRDHRKRQEPIRGTVLVYLRRKRQQDRSRRMAENGIDHGFSSVDCLAATTTCAEAKLKFVLLLLFVLHTKIKRYLQITLLTCYLVRFDLFMSKP